MIVDCVDNETAFLALRDDWEALRLRSENPSCFLSHDWLRCSWKELRAKNAMRVYVVRNRGRCELIAPCMIPCVSGKRVPLASITFIEHPESQLSDMLILNESRGHEAVNAFLFYLLAEKSKEWSVLLFDKLPSESATTYHLRESLNKSSVRWHSTISHESLVIMTNNSWEEFLVNKSPRFRKTLRNIVNRIGKLGRASVRTYEGKAAAREGIQKVFAISDASWKVADGVAITSSTQRMSFFEELLEGSVAGETIRIVILEVDGKPLASETQIIDGDVVYALRSDYDERYADSSPGTFLQVEILKEMFSSSYSEYNFGVGLNPYKSRWTDIRRQLVRFQIYNDTLYGRLLHTAYRWKPKLSRSPSDRVVSDLFAGRVKDSGESNTCKENRKGFRCA